MKLGSTSQELPVISIGLPVYNGEKYIRDALDSLLGQTFTDFELIISDNASTDDTQVICEEYALRYSQIRYVRQSENKGPMANFKYVLDQARGKFFMWAAYDDLWAKNFLLDAMALLEDKNIDFVFPTFELRSIRFGVAKKCDPEIFRFIESPDKKYRILHFIALHYLSLSVNIVYSMFRREFLMATWEIQDISNEGAMGTLLLSRGRGAVSNSLFSKRYRTIWPGKLQVIINIVLGWLSKQNVTGETRKAIQAARLRALSSFPEYNSEIAFIFERYHPYKHDRCYRVCSIRELF
jgi:glycosyltransferase involved in cell wall biosynthesis